MHSGKMQAAWVRYRQVKRTDNTQSRFGTGLSKLIVNIQRWIYSYVQEWKYIANIPEQFTAETLS